MNRPAVRVAVAASGGRDSTALLHCTLQARNENISIEWLMQRFIVCITFYLEIGGQVLVGGG